MAVKREEITVKLAEGWRISTSVLLHCLGKGTWFTTELVREDGAYLFQAPARRRFKLGGTKGGVSATASTRNYQAISLIPRSTERLELCLDRPQKAMP